jgi:hypothetical protein
MDSDVCMPANCILEIPVNAHKKYAAVIEITTAYFV